MENEEKGKKKKLMIWVIVALVVALIVSVFLTVGGTDDGEVADNGSQANQSDTEEVQPDENEEATDSEESQMTASEKINAALGDLGYACDGDIETGPVICQRGDDGDDPQTSSLTVTKSQSLVCSGDLPGEVSILTNDDVYVGPAGLDPTDNNPHLADLEALRDAVEGSNIDTVANICPPPATAS